MTTGVSEDGRLVAYGLSSAGSDWMEIRVRRVDTGEDLEDHLRWSKFSAVSWTHDNRGFFYSRYDEPEEGLEYKGANYFHKLCYHELGTRQSEDRVVYERPDHKEWLFIGGVSDDGRYLLISVHSGTNRENGFFCLDLESREGGVRPVFDRFDAEYNCIGSIGNILFFSTDLGAPLGRIVSVDLSESPPLPMTELVPESGDVLQFARLIGGRILCGYLEDAKAAVRVLEKDGSPAGSVSLPDIGSVGAVTGRNDDPEAFFHFTGFTSPGTVFRMDMGTLEYGVFREPDLGFDPDQYETSQVFYRGKDGTRVPMFLVHRKGIARNGDNPVLLSGYGGFGNAVTPFFSVPNLVWMEMGGVVARPNLRGGSEYGTGWHDAGRLLNKQNVFDDFISAAEWLIDQGYTRKERLGITGASNGGLLVGACMTQRPDLFGACIPDVGVMDMLRFHRFTIGWAWTSDYGSPDDPEHFGNLLSYSPYHNVSEGTEYPPTMVTTADHDDRVFPAHSFKFAAALQHAQSGDSPVLIRIETRAGHGATTPVSKRIEAYADKWAFLARELGVQEHTT